MLEQSQLHESPENLTAVQSEQHIYALHLKFVFSEKNSIILHKIPSKPQKSGEKSFRLAEIKLDAEERALELKNLEKLSAEILAFLDSQGEKDEVRKEARNPSILSEASTWTLLPIDYRHILDFQK